MVEEFVTLAEHFSDEKVYKAHNLEKLLKNLAKTLISLEDVSLPEKIETVANPADLKNVYLLE